MCIVSLWGHFAPGLYCFLFPISYNICVLWTLQETLVFTKFSSLFLVLVHCHPDCLTCSHSPDHCDLCRDPTKLLQNGRCVHSCGLGFYRAGGLCLGMATQSWSCKGLKRLSLGLILQLSHSIVTEGTTMQEKIRLKDLYLQISFFWHFIDSPIFPGRWVIWGSDDFE